MAKQYQWQIFFDATGPIAAGILSGDQTVHTTSDTSGIASATYYFLDSNTSPYDSNYSRVIIKVDTTWIATIDNANNLTVTASTKIANIERDIVVGNPTASDNSGRNMDAFHYEGESPALWHYHDTDIAQTKVIGTNINLGSWTFTLAPGAMSSQNTMYFLNKNDTWTTSGDHLYLGVKFTNILPPDYRPGAILDGSSKWQSHNRTVGEAHILTSNNSWREMRTENGLVDAGNPPSIRYQDKWMNQRLIGKE